jgi:hypothetical protein
MFHKDANIRSAFYSSIQGMLKQLLAQRRNALLNLNNFSSHDFATFYLLTLFALNHKKLGDRRAGKYIFGGANISVCKLSFVDSAFHYSHCALFSGLMDIAHKALFI